MITDDNDDNSHTNNLIDVILSLENRRETLEI